MSVEVVMDVPTPPPGFDWDPDKYVRNLRKHGIPFEEAIYAFEDQAGLSYSSQIVDGERREVWIGIVSSRVLYIAYTERDDGAVTRIVSARKADRRETDAYFAR